MALVRSMKGDTVVAPVCGHFSCSCRSDKSMSTVGLLALNSHCASGYSRFASACNLFSTTRGEVFPNFPEEGYSTVVLAVTVITSFLVEC